MVWHILWDNGTDACGEFPWDFDTEDDARERAEEWLAEFLIDNDVQPDDEQPHFDLLEIPDPPRWRPIRGALLSYALHEAFGVDDGGVDDQDVSVALIEAIVDHMVEADLFCDHSVGICSCSALNALECLRLWLAGREFCTACGGEGFTEVDEETFTDPVYGEFTVQQPKPCARCGGKGTIELIEEAQWVH